MNIPKMFRCLPGLVAALLATLSLSAQSPIFYVEDVTAEAGKEVAVNIRATNATNIAGIQFSVAWDTLVLEYVDVENIARNGAPNANFNRTQVDQGRIGYFEVDQTVQGFDYPDSSIVFTVRFQSLSDISQTTTISFADTPLRFTGSDPSMDTLVRDTRAGEVTLDGITSVPVFGEDARFRVSPNPFTDRLRVETALRYGGRGTLEILDLSGRLLSQRPVELTGGRVVVELSGADFPSRGAYVLRFVTDREQLTRKIIFRGTRP